MQLDSNAATKPASGNTITGTTADGVSPESEVDVDRDTYWNITFFSHWQHLLLFTLVYHLLTLPLRVAMGARQQASVYWLITDYIMDAIVAAEIWLRWNRFGYQVY